MYPITKPEPFGCTRLSAAPASPVTTAATVYSVLCSGSVSTTNQPPTATASSTNSSARSPASDGWPAARTVTVTAAMVRYPNRTSQVRGSRMCHPLGSGPTRFSFDSVFVRLGFRSGVRPGPRPAESAPGWTGLPGVNPGMDAAASRGIDRDADAGEGVPLIASVRC